MRPLAGNLQVMSRHRLLAMLTLATTAGGAWIYGSAAAADGWTPLDTVSLALFTVLFVWIALSFWTAAIGFVRLAFKRTTPETRSDFTGSALPPTAVVMPIYNEDPGSVFAGIQAIYESLQATGVGETFDFFILSDTTDPEVWLAEEVAWARLQESIGGASRVFYRHRPKNTSRKAGNIADFCTRWGGLYRFLIVLDADSLMAGATLVELVRRMEADPQLGILQAPPQPVNRQSLFARTQQFASSLYGPVFLEGFAWWSQDDGNYWGHNAILRTDAFLLHCGLAPLPGKAPLGGEILSHDFVEAALMRRAGYKVRLAHDLGGSYEQCPPTLAAFAERDQRWCQGNMQHIRLILADGLRNVSRFHFACGVMSYLSSPLWLAFLVLSLLAAVLSSAATVNNDEILVPGALGLFLFTMALLLLPKLGGYALLLRDRERASQYGGVRKALLGLGIETLLSIVVAPIMMAFHSTFVVATFLGKRVHWNAQQRNETGMTWREAAAIHRSQSFVGIAVGLIVWFAAPGLLPWLAPVLFGLIFAIPISVFSSSVRLGASLARRGILSTPEELAPPQVLVRHCELAAAAEAEASASPLFAKVLLDPALLALHRSILEATDGQLAAAPATVERVEAQLRCGRLTLVSADDRKAVLSDPIALGCLHRVAWAVRRV